MANIVRRMILIGSALALLGGTAQAGESIVVASTTSTQNSGLFDHILPKFTAQTGIEVKVVAQGTGQALETGRRGDADVLFVHNRKAEDSFVAEGYGVDRRDVMYNDFVLVGPGRGQGRGGCQGRLQPHRRDRCPVRLARRQERHPCGGTALLEGSRSGSQDCRRRLPRVRFRHGRDLEHGRRHGRLHPV
jgi:hypothetical protein